jgi:ABC-type branched-subunit amino acid transport system substrate-binding protein
VEISISYPVTGPISFPEMTVAIEAAQKAVNDSGGIDGRPLKIDVCDAKSAIDPNPVVTCMRSVAANQNIVAEVGDYGSFNDIITPLENTAHLVQIGGIPLGTAQQTLPNAYPLAMPEEEAFGAALVENGSKNPGLIYIDVPTALKAYTEINEYLKASGSQVQLTAKQPAPITATDLSPQVATLCKNDGVAMSLSFVQIAQFLTAHQQGTCPKQVLVTAALGVASTLKSLGSLANGMIVTAGLPFATDMSVPGVKMFNDQMNAVSPSSAKDPESEAAWLAVWAFAQEARKLKGAITRDTVWDQWSHIGAFQLFGMLPPGLNLQQGITQVPKMNRITNHWIQIGTIENGVMHSNGKGWVDVLSLSS